MRRLVTEPTGVRWYPDPWRMALIGVCTLILCSCRGGLRQPCDPPPMAVQGYPTLPPEAYTGPQWSQLPPPPVAFPGMEQGVPVPDVPISPWTPPGIAQPWPPDEYIHDGGIAGPGIRVGQQRELEGIQPGDAAAHFDTLARKTVVEPSNRVEIYAPRFGAVRQVSSLVANATYWKAGGYHGPARPASPTETQFTASSKQNIQSDAEIGRKLASIYRSRQGDGALSTTNKAKGYAQGILLPFENPHVTRLGQLDMAEMAHLAVAVEAARAWSNAEDPRVIIDQQAATADTAHQALEMVYTVKEPPANPKLRLIKMASTPYAEPGDEVSFTLRFDNVGNEVIGNVTILDSLSGRLEYIPDSARCSVDARFATERNDADSLVIRCELANPLAPGQGGVIRFRCLVR